MNISMNARAEFNARDVVLTGNNTLGLGHQVELTQSTFMYLTPAEMSELGHRFIELAAIAEEREVGVEAGA